jgi:hypothetical protein
MKRMMLVVSILALVLPATSYVGAPIAAASCDEGGGDRPMTAAAFSTPSPPANLTVAEGNRDVVLLWDPPDNDGGGVDFYRVYVNDVRKLRTSDTQAQVNNLTNGQTYSFYVTATNDCGESAPSNTVPATPSTGQGAELIGGSNLTMSTGAKATAADPFVGKQTFPAGTTGLGTLDEEPDNGFCGGPCLAGQVLVNSLQNGSLGGPSYTVKLVYDKTALQESTSSTLSASAPTSFSVYYDATKGESPIQLAKCSVAPVPCVAKMTLDEGDLTVPVRTADLDPRLGTR